VLVLLTRQVHITQPRAWSPLRTLYPPQSLTWKFSSNNCRVGPLSRSKVQLPWVKHAEAYNSLDCRLLSE
jgi:hypothetical protein